MGLSSWRAFSKASGPQGYQSTGLWACCCRYGLFSAIRWFGRSFLVSRFSLYRAYAVAVVSARCPRAYAWGYDGGGPVVPALTLGVTCRLYGFAIYARDSFP